MINLENIQKKLLENLPKSWYLHSFTLYPISGTKYLVSALEINRQLDELDVKLGVEIEYLRYLANRLEESAREKLLVGALTLIAIRIVVDSVLTRGVRVLNEGEVDYYYHLRQNEPDDELMDERSESFQFIINAVEKGRVWNADAYQKWKAIAEKTPLKALIADPSNTHTAIRV